MLTLGPNDIVLGCQAADWEKALDLAAQTLHEAGLVDAEYRHGLYQREAQSSTYLGNAIAIPHGTPESRQYVRRTGVRVIQFPQGVTWHDGQRVYVLVAIAAQNDEHLDILRQLTHVLDQDGIAEQLANTQSTERMAQQLSKPVATPRLDINTLCLKFPARDIHELAVAAAARLRQAEHVDPTFINQIAAQSPIWLGQGFWLVSADQGVKQPALSIATPHTDTDKTFSHQGHPVHLVFCLAAQGQAHRPLLEQLHTLLTQANSEQLLNADAQRLLAQLAGEDEHTHTTRVRVLNPHGLHARPAKQLVQVARAQACAINIRLEEGSAQSVSAASLTKVIGLGARRGQWLVLSAEGEGAETALAAVSEAIQSGLGEKVSPWHERQDDHPQTLTPEHSLAAPAADQIHQAIAAAPGMAIAPLFVVRPLQFDYPHNASDPAQERQRLKQAIQQGATQLQTLIRDAQGDEVADILSMHEEMLDDPELRQAAEEAIQEGRSAEAAWWEAIDTAAHAQEMLADRLLAERAADLRDVGRRVLSVLCGIHPPTPPEHPYILVMEDIGPSDVARLDTARVQGILTARGGATAHSAILARALGIAAVVGAGETIMALTDGDMMILDGQRGQIIPNPDSARLETARQQLAQQEQRAAEAWDHRFEQGQTRDGHRIEVAANLGNTAHAADAVTRGAEGVGLLRTEFLFMAHASAPDRETQIQEYRQAIEALDGRPLVARTLDVGGDKPLPYWPVPQEDNPFLGLRGIRLALTQPEVLDTQLEALLIAAKDRPLRIMLPMVKDIAEFRRVRERFDQLLAALPETERATDVQLGVMIEVPSSALLAPTLAAEVDFFSIGTNDLTQYTLAIDRGHPELSAQADGLHPAVLRLIQMTVEAAHAQDKWVGVCGELASDSGAVPILVGLGVDELSVSARQIPLVKARLREFDLMTGQQLAQQALTQATSADVRDLLENV
ncbi:phosphoenolpyruvate--protein phosphotransferase [Terasakiispira papahanaumokuakeensis]|uniref:phosphoenolpyruvate--protein phosphotransferase n=1 Tax=Terasakiispira papahanaumokuakeensis TaxID=197479 RepID=A0A1E2V833_9GAMM|nr:phosphoenolpyruvate--protein phosphotransferase [Terasakiispira papahanaumokuakeensis]ODC03012.1 phosphoenolpyruvate--protein phosphotransferase [Terasakiispira papahanaumokuakeensis]